MKTLKKLKNISTAAAFGALSFLASCGGPERNKNKDLFTSSTPKIKTFVAVTDKNDTLFFSMNSEGQNTYTHLSLDAMRPKNGPVLKIHHILDDQPTRRQQGGSNDDIIVTTNTFNGNLHQQEVAPDLYLSIKVDLEYKMHLEKHLGVKSRIDISTEDKMSATLTKYNAATGKSKTDKEELEIISKSHNHSVLGRRLGRSRY